MSEKVKDWDNMSNSSIKKELEGLLHRQISLKDKIIKLSEKLEDIEKDYFYGNKILVKRYKGE
jgi:hypothetical protein|tara:strand:+ start:10012 stop:10200 length:189 start_codon:yes stop_codon:yes gene_type:complete